MKTAFSIAIAAALLVGFSSSADAQKRVARVAKYNAAEYAPYAGSGSARIAGQAFAKTRGGDVKYAAGNRVWLYPVTAMTTEWYETALKRGIPMEEADGRMMQHHRMTIADGQGNFEFTGLPAGQYYVVTQVSWEIPGRSYAMKLTGAGLFTKVRVGPGESQRIILTPETSG
jgi:hypothetical protein